MQNPRGKLLALLAVFAAIGIITSTGAFTTVSAERTADISVSGDASALLALGPADGANGEYANYNDDGMLEIDLSGGPGVNDDAITDIQHVFTITNNGNQNVSVSITDEDLDGDGNEEDTPEDGAVTFYNGTISGVDHTDGGLEDNSVELETGQTVVVSIYVDTFDVDEDDEDENDLIDRITIEANAV